MKWPFDGILVGAAHLILSRSNYIGAPTTPIEAVIL